MPGTIYVRGGFNTGLPDASDSLRRRMAQADADYERESARQARDRELHTEQLQANAIEASVRMAEERGDAVSLRDRLNGVGRTRSEAIAFYSAVQDVEDHQRAVTAMKRFQQWEQGQTDLTTGDLTAPTSEERGLQAAREHDQMVQRAQRFRHREAVSEAVQTVRRQLFGRLSA